MLTRILVPAFILLLICILFRLYYLRIRIGKFGVESSPLSLLLSNVRRRQEEEYLSIECIRLQFHLPTSQKPRWCTFTATNVDKRDSKCHISVGSLRATLWLFPHLLRFTGGTWVSVDMDDFRLRVYTSEETPGWVENLRRNLITSIFTGEYLRLDDLKTTAGFAGDEVVISFSTQNWHIRNWDDRIYSLAKVDAQLRQNWTEGSGTFVMIAEESRWTKVQSPAKRDGYRSNSFLMQTLLSVAYFPSDVWKVVRDPMCMVDVYASRADITFDGFRIRDSEVVREIEVKARQAYEESY